jgi:hypothetical protein
MTWHSSSSQPPELATYNCEYYIMYTHICSTHLCHYSRLGGLHRSIWEPFVPNTTSLFTHLWSTYLETSRVHDVHHCQLFIKEPCHVQTIYLVQFIVSVHKIPQSLSTLVHDLKDQTGRLYKWNGNLIRICCIVRLHRGLEKLDIHDFGYGQFNKLLVCVIAQWRLMKMNPHMKYVIWCGSRTQYCKIASMHAGCEQNQQWNNIFGHAGNSCANSIKSVLNVPFQNKKRLGSNN